MTATLTERLRLPPWVFPADRPRSWRPGPIHRRADLPDELKLFWVALLGALVLLPVLSAIIVVHQGWRPSGDNALIGLRIHDVLRFRFPLIGQPSTGENFGSGIATNHPGPIEFYLVAPIVAVFGPTLGLALGAALINAAGLVGIAWLAFRRGGMGLMVGASLGAVLMVRSFGIAGSTSGGNMLHDPVSSNVGAVAALTLLFAAWSVIAGDVRAVPVLVVAGSFALQDHLSFLGTGAPVVLLSLVAAGWWSYQTARRVQDPTWLKRSLVISGVVGVVLWLPVLIDEVFGVHNLTAIVRTLLSKKGGGAGLTFAMHRLAVALAPWPMFSHHELANLGWLHTPSTLEIYTGYSIFLALVAFTVHFWRVRRTDLAALGLTVIAATVAGVYTSVKLPAGAGVKAANLRWMWTVSAFTWIALGLMIWSVLPALWREVGSLATAVLATAALLWISVIVVNSIGLSEDRDGTLAKATTELSRHVRANLPKGRYRVVYAGDDQSQAALLTVGPALVHDLDFRGDATYVAIGGDFARAYTPRRTYHGQSVDGTILVSGVADASYGGDTHLLGRQEMTVNRNDDHTTVVRVYLIPGDCSTGAGGCSS